MPVHLGLRCVPRCQLRLLVFEASEHRLLLVCRCRVPNRGKWSGGGLLAVVATLEAPRSTDEEHPHLLRQC
jgi:hypothetical protein